MDKEAIEKRVQRHVAEIMRKDHLEYVDYLVLTAEVSRIETAEAAQKAKEASEESSKRFTKLLAELQEGRLCS